jgi:thiosulfate/3-mercaptopyruvate sulfurtransferase
VRTLLVDCRSAEAYGRGHVPGALHLDPEAALSAPNDDAAHGGRHPLPSAERLAATFGGAGIDASTFVLALDDGSGWAARCWWLLRHVGHDHAGTLDLRGYRGPIEVQPSRATPVTFFARERTDDTIEADEILARLDDPSLVLLDARAPERWRGDTEPLDPVAGRIPGALNTPFAEPLPDGVTAARELAAYCGSGVTAAVVVQKLVLAGREDARMYPGSFSEWCRREGHPIERSSSQ